MEKNTKKEIEYFIFTNPIEFWKGHIDLICKEKGEWYRYGCNSCFNDLYRDDIIPKNIRKASEEEIEYAIKNNGNLYGYKTEEDKKNEINENEIKEKELLKFLLKKYPEYAIP